MKIIRMDESNARQLNAIEPRYLVSEVAALRLTRGGFALEYRPLASAVWSRSGCEDEEAADFLGRRDRDVFFGYLEGALCGQIAVEESENRLARVADVRVDIPARRKGLGREMLDVAMDWAALHGCEGLVVETQDANPAACQFLEHCGFALGGVDRMRYAGLARTGERPAALPACALFYYKLRAR